MAFNNGWKKEVDDWKARAEKAEARLEKAMLEAQLYLEQPSDTNYERGYDAGITAMCIALGFRIIPAQALRVEVGDE